MGGKASPQMPNSVTIGTARNCFLQGRFDGCYRRLKNQLPGKNFVSFSKNVASEALRLDIGP